LICELDHYDAPPTAAVWQHDSQAFIVTSLDSKHPLEIWNPLGNLVRRFPVDPAGATRLYDLARSPKGTTIVAIAETKIFWYDYSQGVKLNECCLGDDMKFTSVAISPDAQFVLLSMNPNKIMMLRMDTGSIVREFDGHKQAAFLIRSSFGGAQGSFVISGSEGMHGILPFVG
jgi:WD40 repeat protein